MAEPLLVHAAFVRRLSLALAGEDGDDLAQETWVAALQARTRDVRSLRGWLATVAGNLARNRARAEGRRRLREADAGADRGAVPPVADIVAREEVRRQVVDAVVTLPEPLRAVVLLHFFEGLSSRCVGRRLGIPASTARTRLQRALGLLRERLDHEHGERRAAWAAPLLAATAPASAAQPPLALGVLLRASWPTRAAVGVVVLALVGWWIAGEMSTLPGPPPTGAVEVAQGTSDETGEHQVVERSSAARRSAVVEDAAAVERGPEDLWGRVVDAVSGEPVAGAEVTLEHRDADEMTSLDVEHQRRTETIGVVHTEAGGAFAFRVRRALQHRVAVRAAGYAPLAEERVTGGSEFVLRLERPASLTGVVRDERGAPVVDCEVDVLGGERDRRSTRTASDGTFSFEGLSPADCYVVALPRGRDGSAWKSVELEAGGRAHVEIDLEAGVTARGTVRDVHTGYAIAGAEVSTSWTMRGAVTTASDGSYELGGLDAGYLLRVRAPGYAERVRPVTPEGAASVEAARVVDFALERGDRILGRVVDEHGRGLAGCYVAAVASRYLAGNLDSAWCPGDVDESGRFSIEGLGRTAAGRPLRWQLLVRSPGMGARVLLVPQERLSDGLLDVGEVVLAPEAILEGRVVDVAGAPVGRAEIRLQGVADGGLALTPDVQELRPAFHLNSRRARTAADGTYRFAGLGAGEYTVHVAPRDVTWRLESGPHLVAAAARVAVPDVVVDAGLTISGTVRSPRSADAVPIDPDRATTVVAYGPGPESSTARVADDGSFVLERLEPGQWTLTVSGAPGGFAVAPRVDVVAGSRDVVLELVRATTIEGRVVDSAGEPVVGARAYFFPNRVKSARNVRTDDEGRFRIEVAPGVVGRVGATHPTAQHRQGSVRDVVAGTVGLEVVLRDP